MKIQNCGRIIVLLGLMCCLLPRPGLARDAIDDFEGVWVGQSQWWSDGGNKLDIEPIKLEMSEGRFFLYSEGKPLPVGSGKYELIGQKITFGGAYVRPDYRPLHIQGDYVYIVDNDSLLMDRYNRPWRNYIVKLHKSASEPDWKGIKQTLLFSSQVLPTSDERWHGIFVDNRGTVYKFDYDTSGELRETMGGLMMKMGDVLEELDVLTILSRCEVASVKIGLDSLSNLFRVIDPACTSSIASSDDTGPGPFSRSTVIRFGTRIMATYAYCYGEATSTYRPVLLFLTTGEYRSHNTADSAKQVGEYLMEYFRQVDRGRPK